MLLCPSPGYGEPAERGVGTDLAVESSDLAYPTLGAALISYQLHDFDLDRIADAAHSSGRVTLQIDGNRYDLEIRPSELEAPGFQQVLTTPGGPLATAPVSAAAFRGEVAGRADSDVRLVIGHRVLAGYVRVGADWLFLEPLWALVPGNSTDEVVVYRGEDALPPSGSRCGVAGSSRGAWQAVPALAEPLVSSEAAAALAKLRIAVEADGELFGFYGPDSHAFIQAVLNTAQGVLGEQLGLSLKVTLQRVHSRSAADPYVSDRASDLLKELRREAMARPRVGVADLVQLLTGRALDGGIGGTSEMGAACGDGRPAGAIAAAGRGSLSSLVEVVIHQVAHVLSAGHDGDRPFEFDSCGGDGPTMCAELQSAGGRRFSVESKREVAGHLEARQACFATMSASDSGFTALAAGAGGGSITVTEPDGVADRVAEGKDYATYEQGDPWDMNEGSDVATEWTGNITGESFGAGIYSGTTGSDPGFYLKYPGIPSSVNLEKGAEHPIDSSVYRYLSARIRFTAATSQPFQVFFFEDGSFASGSFGFSTFTYVPPNEWQIIESDLASSAHPSSPRTWTSISLVQGLRIDPGATAGVPFEIDWIRLTAEPTTTPTQKSIEWTSSGLGGATFSIDAIDGGGTVHRLATALPAGTTFYDADFSKLAPGDYTVRVQASSGESDTGSGPVSVNQAPLLNFTEPDRAGDIDNDLATVELGNPWGPLDPADIALTANITNLSYSNPPGTLSGDNTNGDSAIIFNTPVLIDSTKYRMLSYEYELDGVRDIGAGSVSRIFWGNEPPPNPTPSFTSDDILVQEGVNTYVPGDMTKLPLEGGATNQWNGDVTVFRFDPHEFATTRHFTLHWLRLSPYDTAAPSFTFEWADVDPDDDASIELWLDADRDPSNGNEDRVTSGLSEDSSIDSHTWNATGFASGLYQVFARVTDGLNTIDRYATGPLLLETLETPTPTGPVLEVVPGSLDFGGTSTGVGVSRDVTLSNVNLGPDTVVVSSTTVSDATNYAVAPGGAAPCASLTPTIASGSSCTLEVTLNPGTLGRFDADLTIVSNSAIDPTKIVPLTGGGCSTTVNQVFSGETVTGVETREACSTITVGPAFEVGPTGDLTLRAGYMVRLDSGFVASGAFTVEIDSSLAEN